MKLDKMKLIALVMEEAQKNPELLPKVLGLIPQILEIAPILIAVWGKIEKDAKPDKPVSTPPIFPTPIPVSEEPVAWLENGFHSWYQDTPDASDMTTPDEVEAILKGEPIPPAANLWLMCNVPNAWWHFQVGNSRVCSFFQEEEKKTFLGPWNENFLGARYKDVNGEKSSKQIILRLKDQDELYQLKFWVSLDGVESLPISVNVRGKRQ